MKSENTANKNEKRRVDVFIIKLSGTPSKQQEQTKEKPQKAVIFRGGKSDVKRTENEHFRQKEKSILSKHIDPISPKIVASY